MQANQLIRICTLNPIFYYSVKEGEFNIFYTSGFQKTRGAFQTFIKSECILSEPTMTGTTNGKLETISRILLRFKLAASNREVILVLVKII